MNLHKLLPIMLASSLVAVSASSTAGQIPVGSWVSFCFGGSGSGATPGCQTTFNQPTSGNPFTFSISTPMLLKVTDVADMGDTFNVYSGSTPLFTTSSVPVNDTFSASNPEYYDPQLAYNDPRYSHGSIALNPGSYGINIFAAASPYGGGGADMGIFPETSPPPPPAGAPTTLELAQLSAYVYGNGDPLPNGYGTPFKSFSDSTNGLFAQAFVKPGSTPGTEQIVVAFRGTAGAKNFAADASFGAATYSATANAFLPTYVAEALQFIRSISACNPGENNCFPNASAVTLTGHSLGGAIAEILGKYTGLRTETFNAPGTTSAYASLADTFSILGPPDQGIVGATPRTIVNNRVWGDTISQIGQPQGSIVTYLPQLTPGDGGQTFQNILFQQSLTPQGQLDSLLQTHSIQNFSGWL